MINNGVYRAGFGSSQEAYDEAVKDVFDGLDKVSITVDVLSCQSLLSAFCTVAISIHCYCSVCRKIDNI